MLAVNWEMKLESKMVALRGNCLVTHSGSMMECKRVVQLEILMDLLSGIILVGYLVVLLE